MFDPHVDCVLGYCDLYKMVRGHLEAQIWVGAETRSSKFCACLMYIFQYTQFWFYTLISTPLVYGAETWSLYEDERRIINVTEMDALG